MGNPPPTRATFFLAPNRFYGCLDFGTFYAPRYRAGNGSGNRLSVDAITVQMEGPVNPQRLVRDVRYFLYFSLVALLYIYNYPKFGGGSVSAISSQKGLLAMSMGSPRYQRNLREIAGDLSTIQAAPFRTLIAAKDSPFCDANQPPAAARILS